MLHVIYPHQQPWCLPPLAVVSLLDTFLPLYDNER